MTKLKICGLRRKDDIDYVNEFQPDYAGFILSEPFWRHIGLDKLRELTGQLSKKITPVGVFVNESVETILPFAEYLGVIQLHGDEDDDYIRKLKEHTDCEIWKAIRPQTSDEISNACSGLADKLLIDSFSKDSVGGTGKVGNWDIIKNAEITKPFFLAGGISADNIKEAIKTIKPYGVDVSSSVETNKYKDKEKIRTFVLKAREYDLRRSEI